MRVERDRFKQAIMAALADKEVIRILDYATFRSRAVNDVIRETGISHSTAYRKIKWMLEEGLLLTEKIEVTPDGKKYSLFRSTIRSVNAEFEHGNLTVEIESNIDTVQRTAERIFSLD